MSRADGSFQKQQRDVVSVNLIATDFNPLNAKTMIIMRAEGSAHINIELFMTTTRFYNS